MAVNWIKDPSGLFQLDNHATQLYEEHDATSTKAYTAFKKVDPFVYSKLIAKSTLKPSEHPVQMGVVGDYSGSPVIRSGQLDKNGKINGVGLMFLTDGAAKGMLVEGQFVNDLLNGYGQIIEYDGNHAIGNFKGGRLHGQGKLTYADGRVEEGQFVDY